MTAPVSSALPPAQTGSELVIGVDGGGTGTTAWIATSSAGPLDPPLGRGAAGPSNPRAVGFGTAQANIAAAIAAAFENAGLPRATAAAACCGLSGAGRAEEQETMRDWAQREGFARLVRVTHDAETILATAIGTPASTQPGGIALIAGTGSLAWGRTANGTVDRTGGWGYLLGDEGGGYWVALAGLRAAVRSADGRGQPTHLLPRLLDALNRHHPEELIAKVYGAETTRDQLAQLARVVFESAATDGVAAEIVTAAAEELARLTATLARKLALPGHAYTLAMTGSLLVHQPPFRELIVSLLRDAGSAPGEVHLVTEPVAGAVALAQHLLHAHP